MRNPQTQVCWVLAITFMLVASGCGTIRKHPHFDRRAPEIQSVGIMPADILIQKVVFRGDHELLYEESDKAEKTVLEAVQKEFAKRGYEVNLLEITSAFRRDNPDIETGLSKLKDKYGQLVMDIKNHYVSKMKYRDFKLSLGTAVNSFADLTNADILIFSTGSGYINSTGENTKNFFKSILIGAASLGTVIPIYASYGGGIHISVVDGDNGDILWHNFSPPGLAYNLTNEKTVRQMVKTVLAKYPKRKTFARGQAVETTKTAELISVEVLPSKPSTERVETPIKTPTALGRDIGTDPAQMALAGEKKAG